ncbi:MAG: quinone oxidoreductase family protein [Gammaproteobacteria bacterium]
MRAARYSQHGGPEVIRYEEAPDPEMGPADVVVRVAACGVNRLDVIQRAGAFTLPGYRMPHIAGMDVAGEVVAVGAEVEGIATGDRVVIDPSMTGVRGDSRFRGMDDRYGLLGVIGASLDGGYAEFCAAPASHVHAIPAGFSCEQAACIPTCYALVWHALSEVGELKAGETVLVNGAGGGVSSAAIQLAKKLGATVLATARTERKRRYALGIGADHAVVMAETGLAEWAREVTGGRGADMIFDHVGPALWDISVGALRPRGRLVSCGATTGPKVTVELANLHRMGTRILGSDVYRHEEFASMLEFYWKSGFRQTIDSEFSLTEAAEAQRRMEAGDVTGKILLKP